MFCISINHKNTPADVRERFAFTTKGQRQFTERLKAEVGGCVVLSTCNRMEIYFTDNCEPCEYVRIEAYDSLSQFEYKEVVDFLENAYSNLTAGDVNAYTGIFKLDPTTCNCFTAAGLYTSHATINGFLPCFLK